MARRAMEDFAAKRLATIPKTTVWHEMTPLALEHKAVNLGQGFPTFPPPDFVLQHLTSLNTPDTPLHHQYCRMYGHLELVNPLREMYRAQLGREVGLMEVLVTVGVTQGLNLACMAFLNPGDELLTFEPYFDLYTNDAALAGADVQLVAMDTDKTDANKWTFCEQTLRSKVTPKTRAILVNTPQNVPGKVWTKEELGIIAKVAIEHDLLVFSDEVYMSLVYDGQTHHSIASFPGMFERTITMCSAGKMFSCTGYKIGWIVAPEPFILALSKVSAHQNFSVATPLQVAIGRSMVDAAQNGYYQELIRTYTAKRALLCDALNKAGLPVVMPAGGFFALADISRIDERHYVDPAETTVAKDWQFCRWLTKVIGVNAIPITAFCTRENCHRFDNFVRFAFCKRDEDVVEAGKRLLKLKDYFRPE